MSAKPTRILIVDDSATARASLRAACSSDPALCVVGEACDRESMLGMLEALRPDLITMDLFLRAESGLDLAAWIMATRATPVVVVTAADAKDPQLVFRALQTGVLEVCAKLPAPSHPEYELRRSRLLRTLKTLARVPVVHRRRGHVPELKLTAQAAAPVPARSGAAADGASKSAWLLLGTSTGGPPALARLLRALPRPFALPIAIVQHMTPGFLEGFAQWLSDDTGHPAALVQEACAPEPGTIYLAGDGRHMVIDAKGQIGPGLEATRGPYCPSIDVLFESAVESGCGAETIAVLLTGMGGDGAKGLLTLRRAGGLTIAQEPASCAVASMPAQAIALGAAELVLTLDSIPAVIAARAQRRPL